MLAADCYFILPGDAARPLRIMTFLPDFWQGCEIYLYILDIDLKNNTRTLDCSHQTLAFSTDSTKISTAFLWFLVARLLASVTRWNIMTSQYIRFLVSRCGRKASANKINGNGNAQTYRRRLPSEILISILLLRMNLSLSFPHAFFSSGVSKSRASL